MRVRIRKHTAVAEGSSGWKAVLHPYYTLCHPHTLERVLSECGPCMHNYVMKWILHERISWKRCKRDDPLLECEHSRVDSHIKLQQHNDQKFIHAFLDLGFVASETVRKVCCLKLSLWYLLLSSPGTVFT